MSTQIENLLKKNDKILSVVNYDVANFTPDVVMATDPSGNTMAAYGYVPAIIVNHVHLSAQLEKLLNNSAATKRTEQYKPVFERKDMLVSSSNEITYYLYNKLCVENIPIHNEEVVELARTIYTSALIAGGYEPDNAFKFIKKFNKLLFESISK